MITVESVQIKNVRAIGDAVFEPLPAGDGSTAIIGPNGVGKSSILTAMLWAMYGVTPDGVPVAAMRRQGTEIGVDDCFVVVQFRHDEQVVIVERGLKGNKDATYVKIIVDGHETSFGKVKAAEAFITGRLGLDAEGFLTAFVVRQKELDGLIKARPADRRRLIERLAGIDRMSDAVKSSREEENTVKRRLDVMPGSEQEVVVAQTAVTTAEGHVADYAEVLTTGAKWVADATDTFNTAQQAVETYDAQATAVAQYKEAVRVAETAATLTERDVTVSVQALADARKVADTYTPDALATAVSVRDNILEQQRRAAGTAEAATRADTASREVQERAAQVNVRVDRAQARVETYSSKVTKIEQSLAGAPQDASNDLATAQQTSETANETVANLRAEHGRLTAALKALSTTDEACCPTCATRLADPQTLINSLTESREKVATDGAAAASVASAATADVTRLTGYVAEIDRLKSVLSVEQENLAQVTSDLNEVIVEQAAAQQAANEAAQQAVQAQQAAQDAQAEVSRLAEQVEAANNSVRVLENARDAAGHLPRLEQAATEAANTHQAAQDAIAAIIAPEGAASDEEIARARQVISEAAAGLQKAEEGHRSAEAAHTSATYRLETAQADLHREQEKMRARAELLVEYEAKVAVRGALDAFRKDRIARIAPELSEVATDFVTRMTDGKFTAVELDDEFTPFVSDSDGNRRPAAWLSGGEESAVALALRVAIGELIAGQRGGLLWLDEVLTAQDSQRRPAMMRAISELPGRQIITINHVAEATDLADGVFEVVATPDGSTVVPAHDAAPVSEDAVLA